MSSKNKGNKTSQSSTPSATGSANKSKNNNANTSGGGGNKTPSNNNSQSKSSLKSQSGSSLNNNNCATTTTNKGKKQDKKEDAVVAPVVEPARLRYNWTGKIPVVLLHEYLQKNKKAQKPIWRELKIKAIQKKQVFSWEVTIKIDKDEQSFRTKIWEEGDEEKISWANSQDAKHNCAVVALFHYYSNFALDKHIPHIFRPIWIKLGEEKVEKDKEIKIQQEENVIKAEKEAVEQFKNQLEQLTIMKVYMNRTTRSMCEDELKITTQGTSSSINFEEEITDFNEIMRSLEEKGFRRSQIEKAFQVVAANTPIINETSILEYLLLQTPENELPLCFQVLDAHFEVIVPSNPNLSTKTMNSQSLEVNHDTKKEEDTTVSSQGSTPSANITFPMQKKRTDQNQQTEFDDVTKFCVLSYLQNDDHLRNLRSPLSSDDLLSFYYSNYHIKTNQNYNDDDVSQEDVNDSQNEEKELISSMYQMNVIHYDDSSKCSDVLQKWEIIFPITFNNDNEDDEFMMTLYLIFSTKIKYPYVIPIISLNSEDKRWKEEYSYAVMYTLFHSYSSPLEFDRTQNSSSIDDFEQLLTSPMIYSIISWLQQYFPPLFAKFTQTTTPKTEPQLPTNIPSPSNTFNSTLTPTRGKASNNRDSPKTYKVKKSSSSSLRNNLSDAQINAFNTKILKHHEHLTSNPTSEFRNRSTLPIASFKDEIIQKIANSHILIVSGETGCGKSTQLPQFILEDRIYSNSCYATNIVCTQPRRLSAIGVANRIAKEMNVNVGDLVGYSVRLDKKLSASTKLVVSTIGSFLQTLLHSDDENSNHEGSGEKTQKGENVLDRCFSKLSHIIIDEVHERSIECDYLLILLKQYLMQRIKRGTIDQMKLKIVLMSATLSNSSFSEYFNLKNIKVETMHIPGFTFPVEHFFLDDFLPLLKSSDNDDNSNVRSTSALNVSTSPSPLSGKSNNDNQSSGNNNNNAIEKDGEEEDNDMNGEEIEKEISSFPRRSFHDQKLDFYLLEKLIGYLVDQQLSSPKQRNQQNGSILVFLPGMAEIVQLMNQLSNTKYANKLQIIPLHSSIPLEKQQSIFQPPKPQKQKIILSTNIAETSITIPDVITVIDSGKVKQMTYDSSLKLNSLVEIFTSKSSIKQRSGRAGRVQQGRCYHLYTKRSYDQFEEFETPEILRAPIHQLFLSVAMLLSSISNFSMQNVLRFFSLAIQPPSHQSLLEAADYLLSLGALRLLDSSPSSNPQTPNINNINNNNNANHNNNKFNNRHQNNNTEKKNNNNRNNNNNNNYNNNNNNRNNNNNNIGGGGGGNETKEINEVELTAMGKHLSKLAIDVALGKILIYSTLLHCVDPILTICAYLSSPSPILSPIDHRNEARVAQSKFTVKYSDHLTICNIFYHFLAAKKKRSEREFCSQHYFSHANFEVISQLRVKYAEMLADLSFLDAKLLPRSVDDYYCNLIGGEEANSSSTQAKIIQACLCAGLYPNVIKIQPPIPTFIKVMGGTVKKANKPSSLQLSKADRQRVYLHPKSINFTIGDYPSNWLVYYQIISSSKVFAVESSLVFPYPLLLFGGKLSVDYAKKLIIMDDWIKFEAEERIAVIIHTLRNRLDQFLLQKLADPLLSMNTPLLRLINQMIKFDGLIKKPI